MPSQLKNPFNTHRIHFSTGLIYDEDNMSADHLVPKVGSSGNTFAVDVIIRAFAGIDRIQVFVAVFALVATSVPGLDMGRTHCSC